MPVKRTEIEKKLYTLLDVYGTYFRDTSPINDILPHCTEHIEVFQCLDALFAEWEEAGMAERLPLSFDI